MRKNLIYLFLLSIILHSQAFATALDDYVAKPDPAYSYRLYHTDLGLFATTYFIEMHSQQWRTADEVDRPLWQHELIISVPRINPKSTAILVVSGGSNDGDLTTEVDDAIGTLANLLGAVLIELKQVPNQPLFFADEAGRSRKEDEILAYSMDKYLTTGDPEWPVHLAMTKAAVRALDTIQTFLNDKEQLAIEDFIVLGGSKRGWTSWLTAAVDSRVKAIVPASIDMLNLNRQFKHQWEAYGFFAPALDDYVKFDLPCRMQSARGEELLTIIDPYAYRDRYTLPKLILNATGDQFFLPDSSRFYYDDLPDGKQLRYSVNTDHSQGESVLISALSWIDDLLGGTVAETFDWSFEADGSIRVETPSPPDQVKLWQATNPNARDFRLETLGAVWTSTPLADQGNGVYIGQVNPPAQGWTAFLVELTYADAAPLKPDQIFSTGVRVTPDSLPFAGTFCGGANIIFSDQFED